MGVPSTEIERAVETVQLLRKIADEERMHFNILENLYAFAQEPQNFSAWIEFTDFKGY